MLAQLIARAGAVGLTPQQMMRQMFDTQIPHPGLADPSGPQCDDHLLNGAPSFNGFPRRCPTPEGAFAATPYLADEYFTLGIRQPPPGVPNVSKLEPYQPVAERNP